MAKKNIISFIGLAIRAGCVNKGETLCEKAVNSNKAKLVLIADDASPNTKKKFRNHCEYYGVKCLEYGSKEEFGKLTGSDVRAVLSVNDESFAKRLTDMIVNEKNGGAAFG